MQSHFNKRMMFKIAITPGPRKYSDWHLLRWFQAILYSFALTLSFAQNETQLSIIPPSPNAASLGKYGAIPVSNYTGIPNISIPLYDVKVGPIALPISLNYHASGIKVEEEASSIGLGWSLNAGGVITKTIVGKDDDIGLEGYFRSLALPDPVAENGTIIASGLHNVFMHRITCSPKVNGQTVDYSNVMGTFKFLDQQPDSYFYNFCGSSGKFLIQKDRTVMLTNQAKVKITYDDGGWTLINSDGIRYEFRAVEKTFVVIGSIESSSSWYLTRIVAPTGEEIFFTYENSGISYSQPSLTESTYNCLGGDCPPNSIRRLYTYYNTIFLSKITWNNGQVHFIRDLVERSDVTASNRLKKIRIYRGNAINPAAGDLEKEYDLHSSYFVTTAPGSNYSQSSDEAFAKRGHRLRLDKLIERNGALEKPPFVFTYNSTELPFKTSFARDHWGYYNGANSNSTLIPPFAGTLRSPSSETIQYLDLSGGNRSPSQEAMKAGVLEAIQYPGGGRTLLEYTANEGLYEGPDPYRKTIQTKHTALVAGIANQFQQQETTFVGFANGEAVNAGECQVKIEFSGICYAGAFPNNDLYWQLFEDGQVKQTWFGSPKPAECSLNYSYIQNYSVSLTKGKSYKLKVTIPMAYRDKITEAKITISELTRDPNPNEIVGGLRISKITDYPDAGTSPTNIKIFQYEDGRLMTYPKHERIFLDGESAALTGVRILQRSSTSNLPLGTSAQGSHIGYGKVTVYSGLTGENGMTVFTYHNYPDLFVPYGERYPGIPAFPDLRNGQIKMQENYSKQGGQFNLVKRSKSDYLLVNQKTTLAAIVEQRSEFGVGVCPFTYNMFLHYYEIPSAWLQLQRTEETLIDQFNSAIVATTTTDFHYDNPAHYQPTRTVRSTSQNEKTIEYNTFPEDYQDNSGFIGDLKGSFVVTVPIEEVVIRQNLEDGSMHAISGKTTTYRIGGKGLIDRVYTLNAESGPIPLSSFKLSNRVYGLTDISGNSSRTVFEMDGEYEEILSYQSYYSSGRVKEVKGRNGILTTYLWGYQNSFPIAAVRNASYNDVVNILGQSLIEALNAESQTDEQLRNSLTALRTHPSLKNAQVDTYTYHPIKGMTSSTDANNITTYFRYDQLGRLNAVLNNDKEIIRTVQYQYQQQ